MELSVQPQHYLLIPENPCFHIDDCDCDEDQSHPYITHTTSCPRKEMGRFIYNGEEVVWEEFDCLIGFLSFNYGIDLFFRHYLDPALPLSSDVVALYPGRYEIEGWNRKYYVRAEASWEYDEGISIVTEIEPVQSLTSKNSKYTYFKVKDRLSSSVVE